MFPSSVKILCRSTGYIETTLNIWWKLPTLSPAENNGPRVQLSTVPKIKSTCSPMGQNIKKAPKKNSFCANLECSFTFSGLQLCLTGIEWEFNGKCQVSFSFLFGLNIYLLNNFTVVSKCMDNTPDSSCWLKHKENVPPFFAASASQQPTTRDSWEDWKIISLKAMAQYLSRWRKRKRLKRILIEKLMLMK